MKQTIVDKLEQLAARFEEVNALLADPDVIQNQNQFRELSQEHAQISPVVDLFQSYQQSKQDLTSAQEMSEDSDPEMRKMAEDELSGLKETLGTIELELQKALLPKDPDDKRNIFLEIRAGTGGDEAALFAGDLARMYMRFAEKLNWRIEIMSESLGEHGGYNKIVMRISGTNVYAKLKFESGAHRVQRVPETESQGRIHTSACTVAILAEVDDVEQIEINANDLKIDTYRASGAGGQHVNKTDSAIRITHLPTGVVVECQDERSQHKNRARAMAILQAKLLTAEQDKQSQEQAATRKSLVGSGDRSERIRTYNYPQGRITDHRINLTLYKLEQVIQGDLDMVIDPLINEHNAEQLAAIAQ